MAYERGSRSVEVELSRVQSWVEGADIDLYGRNGDKGVIREHRDNQAYLTLAVTLMGVFGGIPSLIVILQLFHVLPR